MATDVLKDRAHVETRAAPDATQGVPLLGIRQKPGPVVVQQHHVKLLRTVRFTRLPRPPEHRIVTGQVLARACGRQHGQKQRKVFQPRQDFLDPDQRHMDPRHRRGQARVPLVLGDRDHAPVRHQKVPPGNSHVGLQVLPAEEPARNLCEFLRRVGRSRSKFFLEKRADLVPLEVHARENKVIRRLLLELLDELPKVAFHHFVPLLLQRIVEVDLLAGHRLGFDDRLHAALLRQIQDVVPRLAAV